MNLGPGPDGEKIGTFEKALRLQGRWRPGLRAQALAAARPAGSENLPAALGGEPRAEAVPALADEPRGLIGAFHRLISLPHATVEERLWRRSRRAGQGRNRVAWFGSWNDPACKCRAYRGADTKKSIIEGAFGSPIADASNTPDRARWRSRHRSSQGLETVREADELIAFRW